MARKVIVAVLALTGFVVAFAVTRATMRPAAAPTTADRSSTPRTSPTAVANPQRSSLPAGPATSPPIPILRIRQRRPTAYETLVLSRPQDFYAMKRPLQQALQADKHLTRSCFAETDLVGEVTVEFSWRVESTRQQAKASSLQFVQVHDGVALPDSIVGCLERALGGSYETLPDAHPFPPFAGDVPIRLSWVLDAHTARTGER